MSLINVAADLFSKNLAPESGLDSTNIASALQNLLPTNGEDLDLSALVSMFSNGNLGDLVNSFLGDGANMQMLASQVIGMLGQDNIVNFASSLGIDADTASETLSNILPDLIDQNSNGGALGDIAAGLFKSFLG